MPCWSELEPQTCKTVTLWILYPYIGHYFGPTYQRLCLCKLIFVVMTLENVVSTSICQGETNTGSIFLHRKILLLTFVLRYFHYFPPLQFLLQCAEQLPHKIPLYGTVVEYLKLFAPFLGPFFMPFLWLISFLWHLHASTQAHRSGNMSAKSSLN